MGVVQVAAGDLQGIEQESGFLVVDLLGQDEANDLHDGGLDGVAVLEDREERGAGIALAARLNAVGAEIVVAVMKVAVALAAQGRRTALLAVDFDVITPANLHQ